MGLRDYYMSAVKGTILSQCPAATIVDITHEIKKFDIIETAFILKNAYRNFPRNTIHIIAVNNTPHPDPSQKGGKLEETQPVLAVFADGHYFVGVDDGVFSIILENKPEKIVAVNLVPDKELISFPTKDILVKAACHLAKGGKVELLGKPLKNFIEKKLLTAYTENNAIRGMIIYMDSFGNAITNITKDLFQIIGQNKNFKIELKPTLNYSDDLSDGNYTVTTISNSYNDVPEGEIVALFNSTGNLEIAINKGNAESLLGLKIRDNIRIDFV